MNKTQTTINNTILTAWDFIPKNTTTTNKQKGETNGKQNKRK